MKKNNEMANALVSIRLTNGENQFGILREFGDEFLIVNSKNAEYLIPKNQIQSFDAPMNKRFNW